MRDQPRNRVVVIARNSRRRSLEILYVLLFLYVDVVLRFVTDDEASESQMLR